MKTFYWSIIACIAILAAILAVPVAAAGTDYDYPRLDNSVASQKAHLTWKAAERETGMTASIAYISTLNGTTTSILDTLLVQYKEQETQIPALSTRIGLGNLLREMNLVNQQFRQELRSQMKSGRGSPVELNTQVDAAIQDNAALVSLETTFWSARTTGELANFDIRVQRAATVLANLSAHGYDTAAAQANLDGITALRSTLETALNSHDHAQIQAVQQDIRRLSEELAQIVKDLQVQVPLEKRIQFHINEGNRAVARADMINADLKSMNLDITQAEQYTAAAKAHLAAAQAALDAENPDGAKASLGATREDLKGLAQAYRDIAGRYPQIPSSTASTLTSTAQALESTAAFLEPDA